MTAQARRQFLEAFARDRRGRVEPDDVDHLRAVFDYLYDDDWLEDDAAATGLATEFEQFLLRFGTRAGPETRQALTRALAFTDRVPLDSTYYRAVTDGLELLRRPREASGVRLLVDDGFRSYVEHAFRYAAQSIDISTPMVKCSHRAVARLFRDAFRGAGGEGGARPVLRAVVTSTHDLVMLPALVDRARVQVRVLRGRPRLHERLVLVDGRKYVAGSHGFSPTSLFDARELSVAVEGPSSVLSAAAQRFAEIWDAAAPY